jgi:hypothetical protein
MAKTMYEVVAIVGKYTNKEGQEKNRYQRLGSVVETKSGPMLKIDLIPITEDGWTGWCYLNEPKPKEGYKGLPKDEEDLDVPF